MELEFWYEFASTYSYPAASRIGSLAEQAEARVHWKPFLLGPIFAAQGWNDSPFNLYPAKGRYMWRDMERLCADFGLPFQRPGKFPRSGLHAARIALVAAAEGWAEEFSKAVYKANFAEDRDISEIAVLGEILGELGKPAEIVIEKSQQQENKELLKGQTEAAIRLGIFGSPSFVTAGELFWGNDRLEAAIHWATGKETGK